MILIAFICLAVVSVVLGVLKTVFHNLLGWKGVAIRGLAIISLLALTMITANLRGLNNAVSLFTGLALAVLLLSETIQVSMNNDDVNKPILNGIFFGVAHILFSIAVLSLAEFSILALLGGMLAGAGVGAILCAIKKEKTFKPILMNILTFSCVGLLLGFGVNAILGSKHVMSAICSVLGGFLALISNLMLACCKGAKLRYVANSLNALSLIVLAISVYFY